MVRNVIARRWLIGGVVLMTFAGRAGTSAQAPAASSKSAPGAQASKSATASRELISMLEQRKLDAFAVRDPSAATRFIAVLHVPGAQLLVVSAEYERPTDIEYRLYTKDYMGAYQDLNTSILSKGRLLVQDAIANGLKAIPGKDEPRDAVKTGSQERTFDGDFADPKKNNPKKISQDDYMKAFSDADDTYTRLLGALLDGLKKPGS